MSDDEEAMADAATHVVRFCGNRLRGRFLTQNWTVTPKQLLASTPTSACAMGTQLAYC